MAHTKALYFIYECLYLEHTLACFSVEKSGRQMTIEYHFTRICIRLRMCNCIDSAKVCIESVTAQWILLIELGRCSRLALELAIAGYVTASRLSKWAYIATIALLFCLPQLTTWIDAMWPCDTPMHRLCSVALRGNDIYSHNHSWPPDVRYDERDSHLRCSFYYFPWRDLISASAIGASNRLKGRLVSTYSHSTHSFRTLNARFV